MIGSRILRWLRRVFDSGILSDRKILEAMHDGRIVIEPFNRAHLSTSSYDVCIGEHYYREQAPRFANSVFNIYNPAHVERVWGEAQCARAAREELADLNFEYVGIEPDDRVIMLAPGETILAHTEEFIGGRVDITTMMKARSSLGRCFILVCKCAGWGDVGYINRWTMEVTNISKYHIPLLVGGRVAQLIFMHTGAILDKDYGETGHYQDGTDLAQLRRAWRPESMLPRLRR